VPLTSELSETAVSPLNNDAVMAGLYPLFRPIYQFINGQPEPDSALAKFIKFELSADGQAVVVQSGFYSITSQDEHANQTHF
jgi:phosphate transport system substrate-binding protein